MQQILRGLFLSLMQPDQTRELIQAIQELVLVLQQQSAPSAETGAAQILLSLVPVIGIVFGSTLLFFFLFWNYQLRREMIRTNQYRQTSIATLRLFALFVGLLSLCVGLPMTGLFLAIEGISYVVLGGLVPLFAGLGLLVFYVASRKKEQL
ncbi:MAG: hypothetical protein KDK30_00750 [Leptospiraceae bacterium]|nr:hypothetical protein [Leptospiraceae bacterium]MCB1316147.1 hypothetical protein [Leptospiraceae bacterium]